MDNLTILLIVLLVLLLVNVGLSSACLYKLNSSEKYEDPLMLSSFDSSMPLFDMNESLGNFKPEKSLFQKEVEVGGGYGGEYSDMLQSY